MDLLRQYTAVGLWQKCSTLDKTMAILIGIRNLILHLDLTLGILFYELIVIIRKKIHIVILHIVANNEKQSKYTIRKLVTYIVSD